MTLLSCMSVFSAASTNAQEFLCDAVQSSAQELPLLASSCPIGDGLWGKKPSRNKQSIYWIQCGVLAKPLTLAQAKVIYQHISTDVWAKLEGRNARCLIGPYQDFAQAQKELVAVKKIKPYQQAFIREVVRKSPVNSAEKVIPSGKAAVPLATQNTESQWNKLEISVRHEIKIGDVSFKVPYLPLSDEQFYMEYDKPWSRLDFAMANKVCHDLDMKIPTKEHWDTLLEAQVMQTNQWPMQLPYWGRGHTALFASGKVTQTSGKSLLNVMCVSQ